MSKEAAILKSSKVQIVRFQTWEGDRGESLCTSLFLLDQIAQDNTKNKSGTCEALEWIKYKVMSRKDQLWNNY